MTRTRKPRQRMSRIWWCGEATSMMILPLLLPLEECWGSRTQARMRRREFCLVWHWPGCAQGYYVLLELSSQRMDTPQVSSQARRNKDPRTHRWGNVPSPWCQARAYYKRKLHHLLRNWNLQRYQSHRRKTYKDVTRKHMIDHGMINVCLLKDLTWGTRWMLVISSATTQWCRWTESRRKLDIYGVLTISTLIKTSNGAVNILSTPSTQIFLLNCSTKLPLRPLVLKLWGTHADCTQRFV